MGLHLILVRIKEPGENQQDDLEYDEITDWDSDRYGGDKEFNMWVDKVWRQDFWRPCDIEITKKWIKAHIEPQLRLLTAMRLMEMDENVWFKTSW